MEKEQFFESLLTYLRRVPAIKTGMGHDVNEEGLWWVKFQLDIDHSLAWHVVQELGCVVNYISVTERLPTIFYPVSPAPYLNGGPSEYLSWVIENREASFTAANLAEWLDARLPRPVEDESQWKTDEFDDETDETGAE